MTTTVSMSAASRPHARSRKRRPAAANAAAPAARPLQRAAQLRAVAAPAAAPNPAAAAPAAAPVAPPVAIASPEYSPVDLTGVIGDIAGGVSRGAASPYIKDLVDSKLSPEQFPFLGTPYGEVIPGKLVGLLAGQVGGAVGSVLGDALRGVLHGSVPGVEEGKPGSGWTPPPPNKLLASLVKGVTTGWMNLALKQAFTPPPPPPPPVYPPDVTPLPPAPVPAPAPPKEVLGQPLSPVLKDAGMGVISMAISTLYDQAVGPIVQRAINVLTGNADEEVKAPAPLTPGKVVNGFVDSVLSSLLIRSVKAPPTAPPAAGAIAAPGATAPSAMSLGVSVANGILGAAWSTIYGRGIGPALENGVNELAGLRSKEDVAKAPLPALEHFSRAATRGVAVGATTYVLGNALTATMVKLGASIGGVGGALVSIAGAALVGAVGGSVVDATVGSMLGKLGGQIYSWISGNPAYEERMKQAPAPTPTPLPGPTPGSPVNAPNGNPGTVPAPTAPAPAGSGRKGPVPIAHVPGDYGPAPGSELKRRKRVPTGNAAVDRTAPARGVPSGRLVQIALQG